MQRRIKQRTSIGFLAYRDCIFLDDVEIQIHGALILSGEINTSVIENYTAPDGFESTEDVPFRLAFSNVLGFQMLELDTWHDQNSHDDSRTESSFDEIVDSKFLAGLRGNGTKLEIKHKHCQCMTYDDVFDIVASGYDIQFGMNAGTKS